MTKEISMEEHKKELASYIERPIRIHKNSYEKLVEIAKKTNKPPEKVIEGFIDDMYNYLKDTGDL